jgi:spore maturation protein CgeB
LISKIVELAQIIVSRTSEANQQILLDNLVANLSVIVTECPLLIERLSTITTEQVQTLAIIDEVDTGWVLYEQRQGQWLALTTQAGSLQRAAAIIQNSTQHIVYFLGIGFGEEVVAWHRHTADNPPHDYMPGFTPAIFLFESTAVYFLLFLLTADRKALLLDSRVSVFVGQNAFEDFMQFALLNSINYPTARLTYSFALDRNLLESQLELTLQTVSRHQNTMASAAFTEMATYYDAQFGHRLAEKIAQKRYGDIKVMGMTSRYSSFVQFCNRDLLFGFADLGCQVDIMMEPTAHYLLTGHHKLMSVYHALPDLIINIDNLRSNTIPQHLPHHTWIQDDLAQLINPTIDPLTAYDFVDVFGSGWQARYQQRPFYAQHPIGVLPLAFHEGVYFPIANTVKDIDVLYVSHLIDPALTLAPYRLNQTPKQWTPVEKAWFASGGTEAELAIAMQAIAQAIDALPMDALLPLFESEAARQSWLRTLTIEPLSESLFTLLSELNGYRARIGSDILSQLKLRPMQQLAKAGISLAIYGKHWNYYPELAHFAHGAADNGTALNDLHNRSKICINNSALVSFHMRALEIMASGAFMLSRRIPFEHDIMPITELFIENTEVALFHEDNLVERVHYYLEHDAQRERMAQAALVKLQQNHTYKQRAEHILTDVMQRFI